MKIITIITALLSMAFVYGSAAVNREFQLLGLINKSGFTIIFDKKIVRNNKYLSFKENVSVPFLSWRLHRDETKSNFVPEGALLIKINGKYWYFWTDDFGFKYTQLKSNDASYDDCITQFIRWDDIPLKAYLTIDFQQNRIEFILDKKQLK